MASKRNISPIFRECIAEFVGTAIIIAFGNGVVASAKLEAHDHDTGSQFAQKEIFVKAAFAQNIFVNAAWGLGVTFGILASFDVSGAQLNSAVTLNAIVYGGFPICKGLMFMVAQTLGAFFGAFIVSMDYAVFKGGAYLTNFYCTSPSPGLSTANACFDEFIGTFLLMLGLLSITNGQDKFNKYHVAGFAGALIFAIGNAYGVQTGFGINPARDFGPRMCYLLFAIIYGESDLWGTVMGNGYFIVPIVFPFLGAVAAGTAYKYSIEIFLGDKEKGIGDPEEYGHSTDNRDVDNPSQLVV